MWISGSLSYPRHFKGDFIKIEGTFVRNIIHNKVDYSIVRAINNIAHQIHSQTIAEFVEDKAILKTVTDLKIDFAQGFAVGRPVPLECVWTPVKAASATF